MIQPKRSRSLGNHLPRKNEIRINSAHLGVLPQQLQSKPPDRHPAGLSVFSLSENDNPLRKVNLLPGKVAHLAGAHSGGESKHHQRKKVRGGAVFTGLKEPFSLFIREEACSAGGLPFSSNPPGGI